MLLEAPQIWRMKRYNVLETELVYSAFSESVVVVPVCLFEKKKTGLHTGTTNLPVL